MYYPAQPSVAFCSQGLNELLPLTICSDTSKDLTDMYVTLLRAQQRF
jgi:hypothetical protein